MSEDKITKHSVGRFVLTATFDGSTGQTKYQAHTATGLSSEECDSVPEALRGLADEADACPEAQARRPLFPTTPMAPDPIKVLMEASDEALAVARSVSAPAAKIDGKFTDVPQRAYATKEGEAIGCFLNLPPLVRTFFLRGTDLDISVRRTGVSDMWLVTLTRGTTKFQYALLRTDIHTASGEKIVSQCEGFVTVPECEWEQAGLPNLNDDPLASATRQVEEGPKMLRNFGDMLRQFHERGCEDFAKLPPNTEGASLGPGPLLAYLCGIIRWMSANNLTRVGTTEMHNPWYGLAIALAHMYGINDPDQAYAFGLSQFDNFVAMTPAVELAREQTMFCTKPTSGVQ